MDSETAGRLRWMLGLVEGGDVAGWAIPSWMLRAPCRDVDGDLFFPTGRGAGYDAARQVCDGCGLADDCLAFALEEDIRLGMWGGLTPSERDRLDAEAA